MEHIRQFDWFASQQDVHFLSERVLDNCVIEKILRNKFRDPLLSDSDDEDTHRPEITWDEIFKKTKENDSRRQIFIPGLRALPPYPKLSALTEKQHYQCLKVLCAENPDVLELEFIPPPTRTDQKVFEEVKDIYAKEQQEYIEWAKTLWTNGLCTRALRPKPAIEKTYDAEFNVRMHALKSFPQSYDLAAQIPMDEKHQEFELLFDKDLIDVNIKELPKIDFPEMCQRKFNIMRQCPVPKPCTKHPCRFVLPTEKSMSILPLTEIHRELAQYAADNGASYIASENALRCLVEHDRQWMIPLSVFQVIGTDGDTSDVVVMGSPFPAHRQSAPARTYRAFRHLLEHALIPLSEKNKLLKKSVDTTEKNSNNKAVNDNNDASSDEEDGLVIDDTIFEDNENEDSEEKNDVNTDNSSQKSNDEVTECTESQDDTTTNTGKQNKNKEYYSCTCKETIFEKTPPRSYRKWSLKNCSNGESLSVIIHCSHKIRDDTGEVLLEPIPEYLIDMGGSMQSPDKVRSLELAMMLRNDATVVNVRVDSVTGDVVRLEADAVRGVGDEGGGRALRYVHSTLTQLQGLRPAHYVLHHQPSHGPNALLYVGSRSPRPALQLGAPPPPTDEAATVKPAPTLQPVLLPTHKFHKILPCAFTPRMKQVRAPARRAAPPPQALKWPKRKSGRKKKNHSYI